VARSGRSRSFANDEPVNLPVLQELAQELVDIHSQHQTLRLADDRFRIGALDLFAGCTQLREQTLSAQRDWQATTHALEALREKKALALRDQEYNRARWQRLEEARLVPGELELLDAEQKQLAHAEELKEVLFGVQSALEQLQLKEATRMLDKGAKFIPSLEELSARLESARLELEDIQQEVEKLGTRTEVSPERLQEVEDRLSLLYELMQKYGATSIEELIEERERLGALVQDLSSLEEEEAALEARASETRKTYDTLHQDLLARRRQAAGPFAESIQKQLRALELDKAVFEVAIEGDAVRFLFSSTGKNPTDIAKAASGGELSRVMLSLKSVMARLTKMPTLVFDEIDTGVSGSAADKMGSLVCEMGADMQVFAITHLPQVAAKGHAHYLVSKKNDVTTVTCLDPHGRVLELARMLSGATVSEAAIANAKALLNA
jgi:DNA repair protein RecN (Recombination protein N)